ncbi:SDR family oxidoreductase [Algoriphagus jejuensis]|uniref:SDR family oxidoreductase n=1 Tax=Algoriphagus jejuensis TaxID=419934 RepID=A0ABN1N494_9BACT
MNLTDQIVWITGASSGLGKGMALEFASKGATVALAARRIDLMNRLVEEIESKGGKAKAYFCDVLDAKSIETCVSQVVSDFGRLDIAVANAGYGVVGKIEELNEADWRRQMDVNVTGLALTCKYALPHLRKSRGRLALIGSVAALLPNPGIAAYGASKAAVHNIGESLQAELMGSGVSCTTIHPGFVDSNIARIDNEGNFHPEREDPRPANLMWSTEKASKVMVKAIAQRKAVFVFTGHGKLLVTVAKVFPGLMRKLAVKFAPK